MSGQSYEEHEAQRQAELAQLAADGWNRHHPDKPMSAADFDFTSEPETSEQRAERIERQREEDLRFEAEVLAHIPAPNPDALDSGIELPELEDGEGAYACNRLSEFFARTFGYTEFGLQVIPNDPFLRDVLTVLKQHDKMLTQLAAAVSPQIPECSHVVPDGSQLLTSRQQAQYGLDSFEQIERRIQDGEEG